MTSERRMLDELASEIADAERRYVKKQIRHVGSGGKYTIIGVHFREYDMALCLEYAPHKNLGVRFSRAIEDMDFGNRFVFIGGPAGLPRSTLGWPSPIVSPIADYVPFDDPRVPRTVSGNAELDDATPNHTDPSKRGFSPK